MKPKGTFNTEVIGQRIKMSAGDIASLNKAYSCDGRKSTNEGGSFQVVYTLLLLIGRHTNVSSFLNLALSPDGARSNWTYSFQRQSSQEGLKGTIARDGFFA